MKQPEDEAKVWRSQVRLPVPIIDWVKKQAEQNLRSVNAELVEVIRQAMQKRSPH